MSDNTCLATFKECHSYSPENESGFINTGCDKYYAVTQHTPEFKYCPFCGKKIERW